MKLLVCLITATFLAITASADPKDLIYQRYIQNKKKLVLRPGIVSKKSSPATLANFRQMINHGDEKDLRTFSQRYYLNRQFAQNQNSPVLLYVCGEGSCTESVVLGVAAEHAKALKATVVGLEHRYYGGSQPFADLSTEHLKYLTIDNALKDVVAFKNYAKNILNLKGKWVTIGGSYPGSLSAYLRGNYPEEFAGALASSAPVQADLDFSEYDHHVAMQAGPTCLAAVQKVVREIEEKIETDEGYTVVKTEFGASTLKNRDDFLYMIADIGAAAVQYGMREEFCDYIIKEGRAGYVKANQMVSGIFGDMVNLSVQTAEDISLFKHNGQIGIRQWYYQSCTEFGFWQNAWADAKESARSSRINAAYHAAVCDRLFGIKAPAQVEKTNELYYLPLLNTQTTNILFTNGSEDPWINLSITPDNNNHTNPGTRSEIIAGGAHCDDLGGSMSTEVAKVKNLFLQLARVWFN